jgi:hypothetical protein
MVILSSVSHPCSSRKERGKHAMKKVWHMYLESTVHLDILLRLPVTFPKLQGKVTNILLKLEYIAVLNIHPFLSLSLSLSVFLVCFFKKRRESGHSGKDQ